MDDSLNSTWSLFTMYNSFIFCFHVTLNIKWTVYWGYRRLLVFLFTITLKIHYFLLLHFYWFVNAKQYSDICCIFTETDNLLYHRFDELWRRKFALVCPFFLQRINKVAIWLELLVSFQEMYLFIRFCVLILH